MSKASAVAALRKEIDTYGGTIALDGGDLIISSRESLPAPLVASLRGLKPQIVEELRGAQPPEEQVSDRCACGALVFYCRPDGTPLCERHSPRWIEGRNLADLAAELAPRIHFTIRAADDPDGDLDHLRELFAILDQHSGGNTVSIRIAQLDGLATYFERQALASNRLRLELATCIRDRALARRDTQPHRSLGGRGASDG